MIHSFAKLLSKILALRLAPMMHRLVSPNQNAFIWGRSIHDNFKYVQQAAILIRKKRIPKVLLKLDVSKAFDTLAWSFLLDVMRAMGFRPCWRRWIVALLSPATSRILLNDQPRQPIRHRRGVRQGDSLSQLLFILAMEVLRPLFTKAREEGVLRGLTREGITYQSSMYADDVNLFAHQSAQEAMAIKEILPFFADASELRTNMAKCSITDLWRWGLNNEDPAGPGMPDHKFPHPVPGLTTQHVQGTKGGCSANSRHSGKKTAGLSRTPHGEKRKVGLDQVGRLSDPNLLYDR